MMINPIFEHAFCNIGCAINLFFSVKLIILMLYYAASFVGGFSLYCSDMWFLPDFKNSFLFRSCPVGRQDRTCYIYGSQLLVANKPLVNHESASQLWVDFWTILDLYGTPLRRPMLIALCGIVIDASWQHGSCVGWEHCWGDLWVSQWFQVVFYFKTLIRFWASACTNLQWFHILALGLSRIQWPEVISHLRARSVSDRFW